MPGDVLVSHIEPKSNVLTLVAPHFSDRLPSENWMIIDDKRFIAVVHPADQDYYLTILSKKKWTGCPFRQTIRLLIYGKTFSIQLGLKNEKINQCQRNLMPLWYRKHMTEFQ